MGDIVVPNWDGIENNAMYGYLQIAVDMWNRENPDRPIKEEEYKKIKTALRWAVDENTAQMAYDYYIKH